MSIPHLELCSGVILVKLLSHLASTLEIESRDIFSWTNSRVVLEWLQGNPRWVKTFVGNRIAKISDAIPIECWCHDHGTVNPADCGSRGMFPAQLTQHDLWWCGPPWLKDALERWNARTDFPEHPFPQKNASCCK